MVFLVIQTESSIKLNRGNDIEFSVSYFFSDETVMNHVSTKKLSLVFRNGSKTKVSITKTNFLYLYSFVEIFKNKFGYQNIGKCP